MPPQVILLATTVHCQVPLGVEEGSPEGGETYGNVANSEQSAFDARAISRYGQIIANTTQRPITERYGTARPLAESVPRPAGTLDRNFRPVDTEGISDRPLSQELIFDVIALRPFVGLACNSEQK